MRRLQRTITDDFVLESYNDGALELRLIGQKTLHGGKMSWSFKMTDEDFSPKGIIRLREFFEEYNVD